MPGYRSPWRVLITSVVVVSSSGMKTKPLALAGRRSESTTCLLLSKKIYGFPELFHGLLVGAVDLQDSCTKGCSNKIEEEKEQYSVALTALL